MKYLLPLLLAAAMTATNALSQTTWQADLDSNVSFYQTTDFGIVLTGTEKSLYAIDAQTGRRIWRRDTGKINETSVTPIPDTDLVLLSRDLGSKSRLEVIDLISGSIIWQSDKVRGDVMQLAVDPSGDILAVVLVKNPRGDAGKRFKGKPVVHLLRLSDGDELWKKELDSDVEMMPSRFGENLGEIAYTLDNYRAPLIVDGRVFLFYDGVTSYGSQDGKEKEREKFTINESGLALTEADPIVDRQHIYISGRGRVRAVDRRTGNVVWKAEDLGTAAEMAQIGSVLYVRTGGQFTRLKDGETESKGPYGVSAIDTTNGKTLWRFKGADKGLTNFVFPNADVIMIADRDDLITIDARTGKRTAKVGHKVEKAAFVLLNERGNPVVGGRDEIASFEGKSEVWRVRHKAPARGIFRIVSGIALRATALYFRYGGFATSAFGIARGGLNIANTVNSFRWSGLRTRFGAFDLTTLASNSARDIITRRFYAFGTIAKTAGLANRVSGLQVITPSVIRGSIARSVVPSGGEVRESVLDRLDPASYADRLSDYLLKRKRLAELRGNHMYFYTDLAEPFDRKGLIGVNIHTGKDTRFILASDPDQQFVTDDTVGLLYSADGDKLQAFEVLSR